MRYTGWPVLYRCDNCGYIFEPQDAVKIRLSHGEEWLICPECSNDSFETNERVYGVGSYAPWVKWYCQYNDIDVDCMYDDEEEEEEDADI